MLGRECAVPEKAGHLGGINLMADDDILAIRQVLAQFVYAWNARNAGAFANLYTDPHVDVNHTPSVESRAATGATLHKRFEHSTAHLSVSSSSSGTGPCSAGP